MSNKFYKYAIVGAGLAGASAIKGIRELDKIESIVLLGNESYCPYNRPPLTKSLWTGKKQLDEIFVEKSTFYKDNGVDLRLQRQAVHIDAAQKEVTDDNGDTITYDKLLISTGGFPRKLQIEGGGCEGICYYRYLDDYKRIRAAAHKNADALVIGGGFIGPEIAAALAMHGVGTSMLFPEHYIGERIFPESLGVSLTDTYRNRGVNVVSGDMPMSISKRNGTFVTHTRDGRHIQSDILIVGIGIVPELELARSAGLDVDSAIMVNRYLQTSDTDIYAAGDNTSFFYAPLGMRRRIEHWDCALSQGKQAGRNMAGTREPYAYIPYFFSDLFDWGYEAVGLTDSRLEMVIDWHKQNDTGVIYYVKDRVIQGVLLCNIWGKVDAARVLIEQKQMIVQNEPSSYRL